VKWPNDVLVSDRKIAGILLESAAGPPGAAVSWLAIGIGVNLRHHPEGTEFPATSLAAEGVAAPDLGEAVERLAGALSHWLDEACGGFAPIRAAWLKRGAAFGTALRLRLGEETVMGRFAGLDEEGALMLQEESGATRLVTAGDVFLPGQGASEGSRL
jgi:BirA family biotin operon repressor/biotin-[acetyl-CoA-carboxylase] ligase